MANYRLSIGSISTNPEGESLLGYLPVYTVSYRHLSDILNSPKEVRQAAKTLFDLAPVAFGFTLYDFDYSSLETALCNSTSSCVWPITILANSNKHFGDEALILEITNRPAYVITGLSGIWYYRHIIDVYNSKPFSEYKSDISYKTLTHKFNSYTSFELESKNSGTLVGFKYRGVTYREQKQIL